MLKKTSFLIGTALLLTSALAFAQTYRVTGMFGRTGKFLSNGTQVVLFINCPIIDAQGHHNSLHTQQYPTVGMNDQKKMTNNRQFIIQMNPVANQTGPCTYSAEIYEPNKPETECTTADNTYYQLRDGSLVSFVGPNC